MDAQYATLESLSMVKPSLSALDIRGVKAFITALLLLKEEPQTARKEGRSLGYLGLFSALTAIPVTACAIFVATKLQEVEKQIALLTTALPGKLSACTDDRYG